MANEVVMSPAYRGVGEAIELLQEKEDNWLNGLNPMLWGEREPKYGHVLASLHAIREAAEDRVDAIVTGRSDAADLNALFEPTSIEFDPTEVVG